ncbi:hypothetical protein DH2020_039364 [Rehmannia glutinosa]|uniref:Nuclease HARBI1 n=1 Tax=Rehmannia glutinosa TaxID=99300 RepID=A0ABR0UXB8_REHGL
MACALLHNFIRNELPIDPLELDDEKSDDEEDHPDFIGCVEPSQVDSNARLMRLKSWLFYHDWTEIFGKYGATGQQAEDFVQAANDAENGTQENDINVPLEHMFMLLMN